MNRPASLLAFVKYRTLTRKWFYFDFSIRRSPDLPDFDPRNVAHQMHLAFVIHEAILAATFPPVLPGTQDYSKDRKQHHFDQLENAPDYPEN